MSQQKGDYKASQSLATRKHSNTFCPHSQEQSFVLEFKILYGLNPLKRLCHLETFFCHVLCHIDHAVGESHFIVIPRKYLRHIVANHHGVGEIRNGAIGISVEIHTH